MDQEVLPPSKRELLRQMSSPQKPKDVCVGGFYRKVAPSGHDLKIKISTLEKNYAFLIIVVKSGVKIIL